MAAAPLTLELLRVDKVEDVYALRGGPQSYLLRVSEGRSTRLELEWSEPLRQALLAAAKDGGGARALGRRLAALVAGASAGASVLDGVDGGEVVVLSEAAELYGLPWELALVGEAGEHLGRLASVRYAWPGVKPAALTLRDPGHPGRVLVAWSEAGGAVPHDAHLQLATEAWCAAALPEAHAPAQVERAALAAVQRALRAPGPPTRVLQLLCHGRRGRDGPELLMGTREDPDRVSAARLWEALKSFKGELRLVVLTVCDSGDAAWGDSASLARALHLGGIEAVVAARAPLRIGDAGTLMEALWEAITHTGTVEEGLAAARAALRVKRGDPAWAQLQLYAAHSGARPLQHRPYRGLLGYSQRDAAFFFGRGEEVQRLVARVRRAREGGAQRWLFITGPSGTGKSSLVRAGLLPALLRESDEHWVLEDVRPGDALPEPPESGAALLLVDQLEELFTRMEAPAAREAFVGGVVDLLDRADGRVVAVGTLRADFLERVREVSLGDGGFDERVFHPEALLHLTPMGRAALSEVMTAPAEVVGVTLEEDLAERINGQVAGEPGALPLVAHVMDQLWLRRAAVQQAGAPREALRLTKAALQALDGAAGALAQSADGVLRRMDAAARAEARRLLVSMVRVEEGGPVSRQVARPADLETGDDLRDAALQAATQALVDARLLVRGVDAQGTTLEIAHEALLTRWGWLREQVEADRQLAIELERLAGWHREHLRQRDQGRHHGALLTGAQLQLGQSLLEAHADRVSSTLTAFVAASADAAAADLRRRRYDPLAAFVGLVMVSVFVALDFSALDVRPPLAVCVSLIAWARWAVFSELSAREDVEGFGVAVFQAVVFVALAARGLHDELADWDTALFMGVGALSLLGMVRRALRQAGLPSPRTTAGVLTVGALWGAAALAWRDPVEPGDLALFLALSLAATAVEAGTWFGLVGERLPPASDAGQLWRILRDGQTASALAALAFLMFIYGASSSGALWREANLGLSATMVALLLTINSLGSLGRERGDSPARIRAWHIGQSWVALGMVLVPLGFARLLDYPAATSDTGRWLAGLGLSAFVVGVNLRRPAMAGVVPLRGGIIAVLAAGGALWPWLGEGLPTWQWIAPLVVLAAVAVIVALIEGALDGPGER